MIILIFGHEWRLSENTGRTSPLIVTVKIVILPWNFDVGRPSNFPDWISFFARLPRVTSGPHFNIWHTHTKNWLTYFIYIHKYFRDIPTQRWIIDNWTLFFRGDAKKILTTKKALTKRKFNDPPFFQKYFLTKKIVTY